MSSPAASGAVSAFVGDRARRVLHRTGGLKASCMAVGFDVRDLMDVHTPDMGEWLLRGEGWQACPHCLPEMRE